MRLRGLLLALLFIGLGMIVSCSRDWDGLVISQCTPGVNADCNERPEDGCETKLRRDDENCGRCDNNCKDKGNDRICIKGKCDLNLCMPFNLRDCDGLSATGPDGCEVDSATDVNNCGGCGRPCDSTNGKAACTNGQCTIMCSPGFGDCDGLVTTGCETNLSDDVAHCGACGVGCTPQNVTKPICSAGNCGYAACLPGYSDCDAKPDNGCETPAPSCASCKDGEKNGNETGVDCGGNCPACPPTCNDGVKNGNETYKDCGGSCGVCWFCKNGKHNPGFGEKGIDCGGPCPAACPTCNDGVKNGDETYKDCGGSCPACCGDGKKNANEKEVDCGGGCSKCPTCYNKKKEGIELGIDCGGECWAVGRFCPSHCSGAPLPAPNNWIVSPNPNNLCVVPYNAGGGSCPSQQASTANCVALPLVVGHDPRRDCLIRAIRRRGDYENGITNCTKPSYNQTCMVNLAVSAGVPTSCNP